MARDTLAVGTRLTASYKGTAHEAVVTTNAGGCRLVDGREFGSLSAAGSAIMGGIACNGWRFWHVAGGDKLERAPKPERKPEAIIVPHDAKVERFSPKSDASLAWLTQFHPPIEIHWCDGSVSTTPFARVDETLAEHNEEVHGRRRKGVTDR